MKHELLAVLAAVSFCSILPAAAHPPEGGSEMAPAEKADPKQMAEKMFESMSRELKLGAEQQRKIQPLITGMATQKSELEKKLRKLEHDTDEKIRALLDDDQKEKFDE